MERKNIPFDHGIEREDVWLDPVIKHLAEEAPDGLHVHVVDEGIGAVTTEKCREEEIVGFNGGTGVRVFKFLHVFENGNGFGEFAGFSVEVDDGVEE